MREYMVGRLGLRRFKTKMKDDIYMLMMRMFKYTFKAQDPYPNGLP